MIYFDIVPRCSEILLLAGARPAGKFPKGVLERPPQVFTPLEFAVATEGTRPFSYDYPRPALTVDIVIATREARPRVLLIRRKKDPFAGSWALPGGFVEENEKISDAARRELVEETGVAAGDLEQLYTAGDPGRDPRGWTVSVAYLAQVNPGELRPVAADDAEEVGWYLLDELPVLAFDHAMILGRARARLADRTA